MVSTIAAHIVDERPGDPEPAQRILIAIHGHEPDGWTQALAETVPRAGLVRALAVQDVRAPAFTSLLPAARTWYRLALAMRRQAEAARHRAVVEALAPSVPDLEVVEIPAGGDPGGTIAAYASEWPADIVVVGRDSRPLLERALLGTIHDRVIRRSRCGVLLVPAGPVPERPRGAVIRLPSRASAREGA
jgi:nucleotide-binding universal stress UspA family protein